MTNNQAFCITYGGTSRNGNTFVPYTAIAHSADEAIAIINTWKTYGHRDENIHVNDYTAGKIRELFEKGIKPEHQGQRVCYGDFRTTGCGCWSISFYPALADTLEQRYGICIRLSTQADPLSPDGYEVHSTTELSPDEESAALISSLNRLDGILSVYPQEFYETFKTETGLGGLRFGFFASMRKPDLIAAGVTVQTAAWYNIFLDVNNSSDAVIHHEIWHAVEKRAEGDGFIISDTEWSSYNPDGFFYRDETDTPLPTDRSTILVYGAGDASSFVEEYSTYAMHEDRATIIEYFFQDGQDYLEQYDTLTAAPLLKKKLDLMAAVTRPVFGTVYWEDIAQALKNGS